MSIAALWRYFYAIRRLSHGRSLFARERLAAAGASG
jgi:hypothetical protein